MYNLLLDKWLNPKCHQAETGMTESHCTLLELQEFGTLLIEERGSDKLISEGWTINLERLSNQPTHPKQSSYENSHPKLQIYDQKS